MDYTDRYIRFDWAVKRLLRNKANFGCYDNILMVSVQILQLQCC